jgi:hypothetical protein
MEASVQGVQLQTRVLKITEIETQEIVNPNFAIYNLQAHI